MSPYLFVLCVERLVHLITDACNANLWKPFKCDREGPPISHLFFADDFVLFVKADMLNTAKIKDVFQKFC